MIIRPVIAWYDMWVGAYWSGKKKRLYILPIPCVGFYIQVGVCDNEVESDIELC